MKYKLLSILLIIIPCLYMKAQTSGIQFLVISENDRSPLFGATVYIESLQKGAVTNFDGYATFNNIPNGNYAVEVSFLGFETLKTNVEISNQEIITFNLKESENELDEIILQTSRSTRTVKKIPTRIEFIGAEELGEKAIMNSANISMVLRESTGIQMQQTSLSSGSTNIRIQGLDGRYTQLLKDGFPLYGGFGSGLSILQIPPLDLQQFEIIKGSASTIYGGGAIAGLVNMVSKTPDKMPELDLMLTQTQAMGSTANVFYSKRNDNIGVTLYGSGHLQKAYDPEDDGFSNLPKTKSISINPKLFYYPSNKTSIWLGINGVFDYRSGGDINSINNGNNGIHQYTEENVSKRLSGQVAYETQLDTIQSIQFKNSIAYFDRQLKVPGLNFKGKQINTFSELNYKLEHQRSNWIFGANLYTTYSDEYEIDL